MRKKGSLVSVSLSSQKGKVGCNSGGKENGIAKYIYITLANINLQNLAFLWNGLVSVFQLDEKFEIRGEKLVQANCLVEIFLFIYFFFLEVHWLSGLCLDLLLRIQIKDLGIKTKWCRGFDATNRKRVKNRRINTSTLFS